MDHLDSAQLMIAKGREDFIAWRAILAKLVLCAFGLWLLGAVGKTIVAPILLVLLALTSYVAAMAGLRITSQRLRLAIGRMVVPGAFALIVSLNLLGLIGTLTGASTLSFSAQLFVAAPFYVLSAAAFITDVTSRRLTLPGFFDYFVYLALPFKLLAGPLETPDLIARIKALRPRLSWYRVAEAWPWIVLGAFMKFVIGDRLAPAGGIAHTDPVGALAIAALFEIKFYFDFAGYSFVCYGVGLLCGLRINRNFAHPFFARNVVMFWRSWHISLGRFLSRYILVPNVTRIRGRALRMVFTSSIFMVSAMWHGGTGNYALWGAFHGLCYFGFISRVKNWRIPRVLGILSMLAFFVMGRLLATDSNWDRLLSKIANLFSVTEWSRSLSEVGSVSGFWSTANVLTMSLVLAFFALEAWSVKRYGTAWPYHAFRRPLVALFLLVLFVMLATSDGGLLYARV